MAGRPPFPAALVELVQQLVLSGLSHRGVARELSQRGVPMSRQSVDAIAAGRHRRPIATNEEVTFCSSGERRTSAADPRCSGCGGKLTVIPCRLCKARAWAAKMRGILARERISPDKRISPDNTTK